MYNTIKSADMSIGQIDQEKQCAFDGCKRAFEGRKDKRFCSDYCRNAAGREKRRRLQWEEPEHFGQINRIIMRNYLILKQLLKETRQPVSNWRLRDEGFEFKFMTGIFNLEENIVIHLCYEYGWYQLPDNLVRIYAIHPDIITRTNSIVRPGST